VIWTLYGILTNLWVILLPTGLELILISAQGVLYMKLEKQDSKKDKMVKRDEEGQERNIIWAYLWKNYNNNVSIFPILKGFLHIISSFNFLLRSLHISDIILLTLLRVLHFLLKYNLLGFSTKRIGFLLRNLVSLKHTGINFLFLTWAKPLLTSYLLLL